MFTPGQGTPKEQRFRLDIKITARFPHNWLFKCLVENVGWTSL